MTASFMAAEEMALRIRRVQLPQSGKDWILLGISIVVVAAGMFLGKRFLPNLSEKTRNTILAVIVAIILIVGGYGN